MTFQPPRESRRGVGPRTTDLGTVTRRPPRQTRGFGAAVWGLGGVLALALIFVFALVLKLHGSGQQATHGRPARAQRALIFLIPGINAADLQRAHTPVIHGLTARGTRYTQAYVGVTPSLGPVASASLGSGTAPSHTGVVGNVWLPPGTDTPTYPTQPAAVRLGSLDQVMEASGPPTLAGAIKDRRNSATILAVGGQRCADAAAAAGWQADFIVCAVRSGNAWKPTSVVGHGLPKRVLSSASLSTQFFTPGRNFPASVPGWRLGTEDWAVSRYAIAALRATRPTLTLVSFPEIAQLAPGLSAARRTATVDRLLSGIDRDIGAVLRAYQRTQRLRQTVIAIASGEAYTPTVATVGRFRIEQAVVAAGGQQRYLAGGGAVFIGLRSPLQAGPVAQALQGEHIPRVDAVYYKERKRGAWRYVPQYVDPLLPDQTGAFYVSELRGLASDSSADVVAALAPGTALATQNGSALEAAGGMQWNEQHVPLILSGAGIKKGQSSFPATVLDVAPTLARLLVLHTRTMDGVVLADSLLTPATKDAAAESSESRRRSPGAAADRQRMSVIG